MAMARERLMGLVRDLRDGLAAMYGDRLKSVYLFGSHARGDAREGADIDVAVVLRGPVDRWEEQERANELLSDLSLREDCLLSALFVSEEEMMAAPYAIHRSILREGVLV
jgi:predicted nucleotidyltransferase